jgi:HK97 gp10 family phage protein
MAKAQSVVGGLVITGDKELDRLFQMLPDGMQKRVLRPALRAAAKVIQAQAVANAPKDTGALKKSIKVRAGKRSRKGIVRVNVTTSKDSTTLYKGKQYYGAFIEFGHHVGKRTAEVKRTQKANPGTRVSGGRRFIEPKPFMRPAFDSKKKEATKVASDLIAKGIVTEALKFASKSNARATK